MIGDSLLGKLLRNDIEHRGKLRKDDHAVTAVEDARKLLQQKIQLAAATMIVFNEGTRMTTDLAQSRQRRKNLHSAACSLKGADALHLLLNP